MPEICYMEALVAQDNERKRRREFVEALEKELDQSGQSSRSASVTASLRQIKIEYDRLTNNFREQFVETVELARQQIVSIGLFNNTIEASLRTPIFPKDKDARDNLILQCILDHAKEQSTSNPNEPKAFLSGNTKEFGQSEAKYALGKVNVIGFGKVSDFMGWLNQQQNEGKKIQIFLQEIKPDQHKRRTKGSAKDQVWMSPDFDEPLDEFDPYDS